MIFGPFFILSNGRRLDDDYVITCFPYTLYQKIHLIDVGLILDFQAVASFLEELSILYSQKNDSLLLQQSLRMQLSITLDV